MMKKVSIFFLMLLPRLLYAQDADSVWYVNNMVKQEVTIPMRDGVKLFTVIYTPTDNKEKHPILLMRTPYSCFPYGGQSPYRIFYKSYYKEYARKGFIMVIQDVRGRWMSEGKYDFMPPYIKDKKLPGDVDESSDSWDTIDWLVKNTNNNNGRVGVTGISFPGYYATMAAISGHPALKAVSPQAPVTDQFLGDDYHHNGAFFLMDAFDFYVSFGMALPHPQPSFIKPPTFVIPGNDYFGFYLHTGALPNFTRLTGDSLLIWKQLMEHPNYDTFWRSRDAQVGIKNIKAAMLVVGGLFDAEDNFGLMKTYSALKKQSPGTDSRLVMGPWYHGQWLWDEGARLGNIQFGSNTKDWYVKNVELPFFLYHLKNEGSVDSVSNATVFFTGENKWKKLPVWPPSDVKRQNLYLLENWKLSFSDSAKIVQQYESYVSDPANPVPYSESHGPRTREYMTDDQRFAAGRNDVLTFSTGTLTEDLELAGQVTAELLVSLSGTDADFIVKLIDVFPAGMPVDSATTHPVCGYQMLVRGNVMRGKYRNSFSVPEPFVPGKPTVVKFDLNDIAHTFKKGHRVMVQVQSSWFPLVDRNPQQFMNIYHAKDTDFKKETITIYLKRSKIILPVRYNR